jgi:DNA-binding NarL/FixJ family response regulator
MAANLPCPAGSLLITPRLAVRFSGGLVQIGRSAGYSSRQLPDLSAKVLGGNGGPSLRWPENRMAEQTAESRIRLVLVDDQVLLRASLGWFLSTQPDFELAGECGTAAEALEIMKSSPVDVVIADLALRTESGDDLISAARHSGYKGRFLIISGAPLAREMCMAIQLGASGIFLKSEALERLVQAIKLVASGAVWVDQKVIQLLADRLIAGARWEDRISRSLVTEREQDVLLGILGGLTNRKIGENMGLSESAVKSLVQQLFRKARVRKRGQLVRVALEGSLSVPREAAERARSAAPAAAWKVNAE